MLWGASEAGLQESYVEDVNEIIAAVSEANGPNPKTIILEICI